MKPLQWSALALAILIAPGVAATHVDPCIVTSAPDGTYLTWDVAGRTFYTEERGNPLGTPIPGSGFLFGPDSCDEPLCNVMGQGTWIYEEANGIEGLQRGGIGLLGDWFPPGCDQNPDWNPADASVPCLLIDEDPINDETCHRGPDALIV